MTLWWIADFLLLVVIVPVVVLILHQVMMPILQIKAYADEIAERGGLFPTHLDAVAELSTTRDLVKQANVELGRYMNALDQIR